MGASMKHHTLLFVLPVLAAAACSNEVELIPANEDLAGTMLTQRDYEDDDVPNLLLDFSSATYDPSACPVLHGSASFDGADLQAPTLNSGGYVDASLFSGEYCEPVQAFVDVAPKDAGGDASFIIETGDGRAQWIGRDVFAAHAFEALTPLDNVEPGSTLRFTLTPALALTEVIASPALNEELEATFDDDGVITVIVPFNETPGAHEIGLRARGVVANVACEGFASCRVENVHDEKFVYTVP
jgi:hypothetical protein